MSGPDLHVFTLKFLALKETGFSPIKNTFQIGHFCNVLLYFSAVLKQNIAEMS
jgi:hypothetical protein